MCTASSAPPATTRVVIELRENVQQLKLDREERILDQSQVNKELIRNLAHEIKNPLGGIRGAAQLLELELPAVHLVQLREYTQVIIKEADRLQTLVDRLLAPHRRPHIVGDVNIHEVCERVRSLMLAEFPSGLTIRRDYDASIPEFRGDKEQLIQTVLNIARNAAQALAERIDGRRRRADFAHQGGAPGDPGQGPLRAGIRLAYHRQWTGHLAADPRPHFLPAGVGPGRRQRAGADIGANLRAAAPGRDRMREPAWIDGLPDPAAAAISARRADVGDGSHTIEDPYCGEARIHETNLDSRRRRLDPLGAGKGAGARKPGHQEFFQRARRDGRTRNRDAASAGVGHPHAGRIRAGPAAGGEGRHPGLPVIIITAFSDLDSAVAAFQGGAFEYLAKPFDIDKAVELIRRALEESLRETSVESGPAETPEILGQAPAMQEVFRAIGRLSQSNVTVLITGESGTGKELVARALHKHSPRAQQPFIALNTAAIPKDLLESELFGHERGAFTGAQTTRRGRFEQAEGGTLFLDEIGDMPFDLQTRLLRVLSDGHFYRVGGHQPMKANVRVITATHQNLEQRVRDGLFREDLYHRLNVIRLRLPSLRERREDIPILVRHFLVQSARQLGVEAKRMSDGALQFLSGLDLPGNVRQLENLCNWITVMAPGQTVEVKDLPLELTQSQDGGASRCAGADRVRRPSAAPVAATTARRRAAPTLADLGAADGWIGLLELQAASMLSAGQSEVMDVLGRQFESALIKTALKHTHGRKNDAAVRLGIGRNTITRKIAELGIDGAKDE